MDTSPPAGETYCDEIVIEADGTVSFKRLTEELLRVAAELNPEDERIRERLRLLRSERP